MQLGGPALRRCAGAWLLVRSGFDRACRRLPWMPAWYWRRRRAGSMPAMRRALPGVPFGKGGWQIDIRDDQYSARWRSARPPACCDFSPPDRARASRAAPSAGGQPVAGTYASKIITDKKYDDVRMVISRGEVKDFAAEPPTFPDPSRDPHHRCASPRCHRSDDGSAADAGSGQWRCLRSGCLPADAFGVRWPHAL